MAIDTEQSAGTRPPTYRRGQTVRIKHPSDRRRRVNATIVERVKQARGEPIATRYLVMLDTRDGKGSYDTVIDAALILRRV